ncbi:MAG: nucleoside deaminase [Oscillospiraceae bacterium]|nr:nucleoside deaminase [Oscillospiraceae bacterium]
MPDEKYMRAALELAAEAMRAGEVPVGCVVVGPDGEIIGRGRNRREESRSALAHAELEAIHMACESLSDWRLSSCRLYVTLEPCPMCAGAIINARIAELCYGAKDPVTGSAGSVINLFMENYGHSPRIYGAVLESECSALLREFFAGLREKGADSAIHSRAGMEPGGEKG